MHRLWRLVHISCETKNPKQTNKQTKTVTSFHALWDIAITDKKNHGSLQSSKNKIDLRLLKNDCQFMLLFKKDIKEHTVSSIISCSDYIC